MPWLSRSTTPIWEGVRPFFASFDTATRRRKAEKDVKSTVAMT